MEISEALGDCLKSAQTFALDLQGQHKTSQKPETLQRIEWMQRQIANLVGRLKAIADDVEAGFTLGEMGFGGDEDFAELLEDVGKQIKDMRGMLQSLAHER
ncbi:MAG: hypothetical protein V4713_03675 [Pseudomonadota bacterium]